MAKTGGMDVTYVQRGDKLVILAADGTEVEVDEDRVKETLATRDEIMNSLPIEIRPQMVPEHRLDMARTAYTMSQSPFFRSNPDMAPYSMEWMLGEIMYGDLYWVSPDMCSLLQHAAPSLPPTTLTADLLPSKSGVLFFATPLVGIDAREDFRNILVQAMVWGPSKYDIEKGTRADVHTSPEHERDAAAFIPEDSPALQEWERFTGDGISIATWRKWTMWSPLGRTDWPFGFDTEGEFAPPDFTDTQLASIIEDRRILAAFALLSAQDKITTTTEVDPPNAVRKRLKRRGHKVPKVRLVDIHKSHKPSGQAKGEKHVEWTHRWIVKGHWRQQAYGEGRKFRRPVYIAPYVKGPEDLPLQETDVVKVWR